MSLRSLPLLFLFLFCQTVEVSSTACTAQCGNLQIPFPFRLNITSTSCQQPLIAPPFVLYCINSTSLFLDLTGRSFRILQFMSGAVLVDIPGPSPCRQYNDLTAFHPLSANPFFAISDDNILALYDCNDSSLCKPACENLTLPDCNGTARYPAAACCYPLADRSVWRSGDGDDFTVFAKLGCRGFSSWAGGRRGVKLEWGIPRNLSRGICDVENNGVVVNASAVGDAVRCTCSHGFLGDGFALGGVGCFKSCMKNGREEYGSNCHVKGHAEKELIIFTGILAPLFIIASLIGLFCILKRPIKHNSAHTQFHSNTLLQKACRTHLFTYHELQQATRGFRDDAKFVESHNGAIYAGVLGDGSRVAVHCLQCENEGDLMNLLSKIEIMYLLTHKNLAHILGCCIDPDYVPLVVYEHPANGTLEKHLHHQKGTERTEPTLDWYRRLKIAAETASVLTFLQCEMSPPISYNHLESCHIFLDADFSAKVLGFGLLNSPTEDKSHPLEASSFHNNDVYDFGVLLLEMVTGLKNTDLPMVALKKIRIGKLEEVVDPALYYHEQSPHSKEQIEIVADLATRCLLFGRDGKLRMSDVSKELIHVTKENAADGGSMRSPAIEETFSNSSLLQMISMSPDSILAP